MKRRICLVGYGKRVGEEFLFIMSRILVGFDIDTVMGSGVADAVSSPRANQRAFEFRLGAEKRREKSEGGKKKRVELRASTWFGERKLRNREGRRVSLSAAASLPWRTRVSVSAIFVSRSARSEDAVSRIEATINIGTIGHVAHGKSTVVKAISGVQTVRFKNELERNITIKLGYANAKIYKCEDERCPRPMCYKAYGSGKEDTPFCDVPGFENARMKLLRHVSFVDCPGHDILMATMLNGAAIMDGALLLIAANESCPQPQTSEHLAAVEIMRLQHIIILQNKVDLIQENVAINQHEAIQKFIQKTVADGAPVIPISAQLKYNIDVVCEYIVKKIPIPERNFISPPNMIVIRSFDVNKPGYEVDEIKGGVAGGSILRGVLKVNQFIEVRPGIVVKDENGSIRCTPIYSRIVSLYAEQNELQFAVPGGLIGVGTTMDPTLTRADRLVGQVLGEVGSLPEVFVELEVNFFLLRRLLGVRTKGTEKQGKVSKLTKGEILMLNIGSMSTGARVVAVKNDLAKLQLTSPVCTSRGEKVALSRRVEKHWRLIGWGQIQAGTTLDVPPSPI
ncbi:hypothetical protein NE237_019331 [Protea cynaroides]|uniref:protein-synthesizing GTPase n=1 Tax=Protea cynaroides TaxID=273540 RepID=A0A9Q0QPU3_9MAGN|nr:hypothetical protein NE237_019331 [Protea cynaroides]